MTLAKNMENFETIGAFTKNHKVDENSPNYKFTLELVQNDGLKLEHAGNFRNDKKIAFAAFCQNPDAAKFVGNELKNDREFMLKLVHMDALTVRYLGDSLRQDKELILTAIKGNKEAIHYVDLNTVREMLLESNT